MTAALAAFGAQAQGAYPTKPIKMVVPFPAGGPTDVVGRLAAQKMSESLGQQVVIENRAGAGGNIGADVVAKSPGDGYTILLGTVATHALNSALYKVIPYDPIADFKSIALLAQVPLMLTVHPNVPVSDVKSLIAYAKANPGKLTFASSGNGTPLHMAGVLFNSMAGVELMHIPYRGSAPALQDHTAGQVPIMFDAISTATPHAKAGSIRPFAVTTPRRSAAWPDVPTMAEAGIPGYEAYTWNTLFAPAKTPDDVIVKLADAAMKAMSDKSVADHLAGIGVTPVADFGPDKTAAFVKSEFAKWGPIVAKSGAKID
jgi:tripartite-type tricarboxylate transporter receptor subunit TctC